MEKIAYTVFLPVLNHASLYRLWGTAFSKGHATWVWLLFSGAAAVHWKRHNSLLCCKRRDEYRHNRNNKASVQTHTLTGHGCSDTLVKWKCSCGGEEYSSVCYIIQNQDSLKIPRSTLSPVHLQMSVYIFTRSHHVCVGVIPAFWTFFFNPTL